MIKYCPNCGTPNDDSAAFCMKCGYKFPQTQQQVPQPRITTSTGIPMSQYPEPNKSSKKTWAIAVSAIVATIIVIGIIAVNIQSSSQGYLGTTSPVPITTTPTSTVPTVDVEAVDLSIQYTGLTSGYLGPTSQSLNGFITNAGNQYTLVITLSSSATLLTHQINQICIDTPGFILDSISPTLPYSFGPGSTFTITLTITVPSYSYNGVLNIVISTS